MAALTVPGSVRVSPISILHADEILRVRPSRRYCGEKFLDAGRLGKRRVKTQARQIEWVRRRRARGVRIDSLKRWLRHGINTLLLHKSSFSPAVRLRSAGFSFEG